MRLDNQIGLSGLTELAVASRGAAHRVLGSSTGVLEEVDRQLSGYYLVSFERAADRPQRRTPQRGGACERRGAHGQRAPGRDRRTRRVRSGARADRAAGRLKDAVAQLLKSADARAASADGDRRVRASAGRHGAGRTRDPRGRTRTQSSGRLRARDSRSRMPVARSSPMDTVPRSRSSRSAPAAPCILRPFRSGPAVSSRGWGSSIPSAAAAACSTSSRCRCGRADRFASATCCSAMWAPGGFRPGAGVAATCSAGRACRGAR